MKNKLFVVFSLLLSNIVHAQDFDIYPRLKDDNIEMSKVYENTLFDEYQLLSRNVRMMDMTYSAIVPGYIHFKANDFGAGYSIIGARLLGYSGLALNYYNMNKQGLKIGDIPNLSSDYNTDKIIFYSSITLIVSSYLFDWIHGKYRLEKKQENIRYKYSIKLKMSSLTTYNYNNITPCLSLTCKF
jgi:hypothetical protein